MSPLIPGWFVVPFLIYILIIGFMIWLAYRFVKAQESMAESLNKIEQKISRDNDL